MRHNEPAPRGGRARGRAWPALLSCLVLAACGGGGGGSTATPDTGAAGGPGGSGGTGNTSGALQAQLSACPSTLALNDRVPCMVGVYQGQTPGTGAACTFSYGADGVAAYSAGDQSIRVDLSLLYSGAVFSKKSAATASGFEIDWTLGIGSGHAIGVSWQLASEPGSAGGLLVKPASAAVPACLITAAPAVAGGAPSSTANLLGRSWQAPQLLNGSGGVLGALTNEPAFDAGLADDGRAVVTFRQPDGSGRMAVFVVQGTLGSGGAAPSWSAPQQLDADAPLLAGSVRPHVAVSANGHAVVAWLSARPCEADAYEKDPAGKTCRYLYAARKLAGEAAWGPALRVSASPPMAAPDHFVRINPRGDAVLGFSGFYFSFAGASSANTASMLALRAAGDSAWRLVRLDGFWSNPVSTTPLADLLQAELDESGNLTVAGQSSSLFGDVTHARSTLDSAPEVLGRDALDGGVHAYDLRLGGGGFAAYTWKAASGPYNRLKPERLSIYSPALGQWLKAQDLTAATLWGDSALVGTDSADGEFIVYSGCKATVWRAGLWGATRSLPTGCGRDVSGGLYAFNRQGDYLGLNWAGQAGQWGYYSYRQDRLLKGAPGSGPAVSGDFVLGTPAPGVLAAGNTQLLLASGGLALAVTSHSLSALPSPSAPAGTASGGALKLWAVYLQ